MNQKITNTKKTQFKIIQYKNQEYIVDMASNKGWLCSTFTWIKSKRAYSISAENQGLENIRQKDTSVGMNLLWKVGIPVFAGVLGLYLSRFNIIDRLGTGMPNVLAIFILVITAGIIFYLYGQNVKRNSKRIIRMAGNKELTVQLKPDKGELIPYISKCILGIIFMLFLLGVAIVTFIFYHSLFFYFFFILIFWLTMFTGIGVSLIPRKYTIIFSEIATTRN
ncbi:DUF443 family protein [Listeria kieliensis]|uniref:Tandem five-TM protein n=1 Tax=Listeria kieliensis TaxID=1621700 RepID=A0A3D8TT15_9LIST|nr:DUF443 family protein [Listeria kieliensis]RDX02100.1 hypothetical protein UR08_00755 [Listeria kieliensis]